jgi:hypothetical protein
MSSCITSESDPDFVVMHEDMYLALMQNVRSAW